MTAGATHNQDPAPGVNSPEVTTQKRSGAEAAMMAGAGVQVLIDATDVTGKTGSDQNSVALALPSGCRFP